MDDVISSLAELDVQKVADWFRGQATQGITNKPNTSEFYHHVVRSLAGTDIGEKQTTAGQRLIYLLNVHGLDINSRNNEGNTALHDYLECRSACPALVEAFLRCNADAYAPNKDGRTAFALAYFNPRLAKHLKSVFMQYVPGLWRAVESDDVMNVRTLVNRWCHTRTVKDGKTLVGQALETGSESVLRVVRDITPSMELAHAAMATDIHKAKEVLESEENVNTNFHNMGDRGATPLYYAILNNDLAMVDLLLDHGARADIPITCGDNDIPLFMAVLEKTETVESETYLRVVEKLSKNCLNKMFYLGSNVLLHSINNGVKCEVVHKILTKGGAALLTCRDQDNLTARDVAETNEKMEYFNMIDKVVCGWCFAAGADVSHRRLLCLHAYPYIPREGEITPNLPNDQAESTSDNRHVFAGQLAEYTSHMERFHSAVENRDVERVNELIYCDRLSRTFEPCLVDSRTKTNWQPALHKAVIRGDRETMRILVEAHTFLLGQRLDSVRDQFHRTVLFYAMAAEGGEDMASYLQVNGASEHVLDKDGRSPQVFKDRKGHPAMWEFLRYHLLQDFRYPEPDPMSVPLPVPIIGYIDKCTLNHSHNLGYHGHSHAISQNSPDMSMYSSIGNTSHLEDPCVHDSPEESETESNQDSQRPERRGHVNSGGTGDHAQAYTACFIL